MNAHIRAWLMQHIPPQRWDEVMHFTNRACGRWSLGSIRRGAERRGNSFSMLP